MITRIDQIIRLHDHNGYQPLKVVAIAQAEDYPPDEVPELCARCDHEINLGQPFREVEGVPGRMFAHSECGIPWSRSEGAA